MLFIELLLLVYFIYVVLYTSVFSFASFFYHTPEFLKTANASKFCILVPSYKEDAVILDSVKQNLNQAYPKQNFDIIVIADSLQPSTITALKSLPIKVVEVNFENSTKVKSLRFALNQLTAYDHAVILDADNVMQHDFLSQVDSAINSGHKVVQGQRLAKNKNNTLARLDGISEALNNNIYRKGATALNLSSAIVGSGIAFPFELLKKKISTMDSVGGFDRELELLLLRDNIKVFYFDSAIVFDEKVSQQNAFQNQRKRWIYSQYFYLKKYFNEGILALLKGNFTFFNSSVLRNIQLPRLINIGLLTFVTLIFFFLRDQLILGYPIWIGLFLLNTLSILVAIPKEYYTKELFLAVLKLPIIFTNMLLLMFKLKGANKKFIHTPHGAITKR